MCTVASCLCISVMLGLSVGQLSQIWIKEVSQEALCPCGLGAPSSRDQSRTQSQVQGFCGIESSRTCLGSVETLDGTGQPDESFETLDASAAVMHQLVFAHSSATARREREGSVIQDWYTLSTGPHNSVNTQKSDVLSKYI